MIIPIITFGQNSEKKEIDSTNTFKVCLANYYSDSASVDQIKKWEEITGKKVFIFRRPKYLDGKIISMDVFYYSGNFLKRVEAETYSKELNKKGLESAHVAEFYKGRLREIICRMPNKE